MSSPLPPRFPEDRTNPYSAPEAEIGTGQYAGYGLSPTPFTVGDVLGRTWQIFKFEMWKCIGVVLFLFVLNLASQMFLNLIPALVPRDADPRVAGSVFFVTWIGVTLLQIWLGIGQARFMLRVARGQSASFEHLFEGGPWILPIIGASLAFGLAIAGVVAACLIPAAILMVVMGGNQEAAVAAFVVCGLIAVIAVIVMMLRLSQFYYLILDQRVGVLESLGLSFELTRGNAGNLLVIGFVTWLINLAGLLACLVGLVFTMPYTVLLFPVVYLALTGQPIADPLARGKRATDAGVLGPDGPVLDAF